MLASGTEVSAKRRVGESVKLKGARILPLFKLECSKMV